MPKQAAMKPLLKWAGGKRWLLPTILPLWQYAEAERLVEPFVGGMSITLGLQPKKARLNDCNKALIHFYHQVQSGLILPNTLKNEESYYYQKRERFNTLLSNECYDQETATLFYYLIRTGFNGLCRFNQQGGFNVPFGQHQTICYPSDFLAYQKPLKSWKFTCGDFEKIRLKSGDFLYVDPPYDQTFQQYYRSGFDWSNQCRLADYLSSHDGHVVASNQATDRILKLYKKHGFHIMTILGPRRIACNGNREPAKEMLAIKGFSPSDIRRFKRVLATA